jgi:hypothetical protein
MAMSDAAEPKKKKVRASTAPPPKSYTGPKWTSWHAIVGTIYHSYS